MSADEIYLRLSPRLQRAATAYGKQQLTELEIQELVTLECFLVEAGVEEDRNAGE